MRIFLKMKRSHKNIKYLNLGKRIKSRCYQVKTNNLKNYKLFKIPKIVNNFSVYNKVHNKIINKISKHFDYFSKGKLIIPCGCGKSYIALNLIKYQKYHLSLIIVPTIFLAEQFMNLVKKNLPDYKIFNVNGSTDDLDSYDIFKYNLEDKIFISTYLSCNLLKDIKFDFVAYDEAHRTVTASQDKEKSVYRDTLSFFPDSYKLFMTATEKIKVDKKNGEKMVFSMENEEIYGTNIYSMLFDQAVDKKLICPYKLIISLDNVDNFQKTSSLETSSLETFQFHYLQHLVIKNIFKKYPVKKLLVFCPKIKDCIKILKFFEEEDFSYDYICGAFNKDKATRIVKKFEKSDKAVLLNCKFFSEGISVNNLDSVYFTTSKTSKIDIVQNIGRSLRKDFFNPNKIGHIFMSYKLDKFHEYFKIMCEIDCNFHQNFHSRKEYMTIVDDMEREKKIIKECEEKIDFILHKDYSDPRKNKLDAILSYESKHGTIKETSIMYEGYDVGLFFRQIKSFYLHKKLSHKYFEEFKKSITFSNWLNETEVVRNNTFQQNINILLELEKQKRVNIYDPKISYFIRDSCYKLKKNELTQEEILQLKKSITYQNSRKNIKNLTFEEKFEILLRYEEENFNEEVVISNLPNDYEGVNLKAFVRNFIRDRKIKNIENNEYFNKSRYIRQKNKDNRQRQKSIHSSFEEKLDVILRYENQEDGFLPLQKDTVFEGIKIYNYFKLIKNKINLLIKSSRDFSIFLQSKNVENWIIKNKDYQNYLFNEVLEQEKVTGQPLQNENTIKMIRKIFNEKDSNPHEFWNKNISFKDLSSSDTVMCNKDFLSFQGKINILLDVEKNMKIIPKNSWHNGKPVGKWIQEFKSNHLLKKYDDFQIDMLRRLKTFNNWYIQYLKNDKFGRQYFNYPK